MDAKNLFWGLVLKPGKRYEQTVEESFHVSKACIEPTSPSGKVASVYVEVDNEEFLLCSLINPAVLNENLDLNFSEEEKICFRVEGEGTVHLTGYLVPDDDIYDPSYVMSDEDEEEEDEELVESDLSSLVKKRKISNGDSSPINNAKKGKLSPSVKATKGSKTDAKSNEIKQAEAMKKILTAKKPSGEESDEDDSEAGSDDDSEDIEDMTMEYGEEEEEDSDEDLEGEEEEEGSDEGSEEEDEEEMEEDEIESSIEKENKKQTPAKNNSQKIVVKPVEGTPKNQKTPQGKGNKTPSLKETPKVQEKPLKESTETPSKSAKKNKNKNKNSESKTVSSPVANGEGKAANRNGVTPSKGGKGDATPKPKTKTPMRTLKGGLMVEDLKVGDGPEATKGKMVGMYYEGRLKSNNKKFDEQKTGKPFRFRLGAGEVIKGWDAGVEGMKVGGKRRLTVPSNMAYGQQGALPEIPSNAILVFEVECKAVN